MKFWPARGVRFLALIIAGAASLFAQTITTTTVPNGEVGLAYPDNSGSPFQFTATGGTGFYGWSNPDSQDLPPGIPFNSDGGFGGNGSAQAVPTLAGTYTFTVEVFNCGSGCNPNPSDTKQFTMHVFAPLSITSPSTIPSATVGQFYSYQFTALGGDPAAYNWSIGPDPPGQICSTQFNGIPPGLCLTVATGVLSGTPTSTGVYPLGLSLLDSDIGNSVGQSAQITVNSAPVQNGLTLSGPLNLGTIALGSPVSGALSANGGTPPYTFAVSGVPAGMTANGAGISGIPTAPGTYSVGIKVTDSRGNTATSSINFSVFGIAPATLANGVVSSFYSFFFSAAGGTPPYNFTASGIPPKFSFSSNGWLNGTPTVVGTYTIAVTATDSTGAVSSASYPFAVTLPPPLKVTGGALSDTIVLAPYSQTLSATGGAPPYTWTLAGGALPDGMTLRPGGTLAGTPTKTGSYTFSAKATDVTGASGTGSYSMNVNATPVTITTPSPLSSAMVTVDYPPQVLAATGGTPPYTFTVPANSLPAGLTLTSDGTISGNPTAVGTSTFTVTATDSKTQTGTASLTIKVRPFSADLTTSAGSIAFALAAGAAALPGSQTVQVSSTDVTKTLNYTTAITPPVSWVSVSAGGTTPGSFTVSLTSAALSLAASNTPYQATIAVTCAAPSGCAGNAQTVNVSLTVTTTPPQLTVLTDLLSFTTSTTNPQATSQSIGVQNTGGGSIGFASVTCPVSWCKVTSVPSSLGGGATGAINITADPTGLNGGYYYTAVAIVTSAGSSAVPVTYFIAANASLALDPSGVQLTMPAGGVAAVPQSSFLVSASGTSAVPWTATVLPGASWLKLGAFSGSSTGTAPGSVSFSIDPVASAALTPQAYYGTIRITSASAVNSPQDFQVVLNVTPATDKQKLTPSPAGLIFITSATAILPPQTVQIFASSVPSIAYQAGASTLDGNAWLSVSPTNGSTSVSSPGQGTVTVSPAGLAAGVYHGSVSYSSSASGIRSVNVTLIVQTAVPGPTTGGTGALSPSSISKAGPAPCTPTQLIPTQTGLVSNFAAPASWPTPLEIQLVSDCGTPVLNGQVVTTFSNGDPPLVAALSDPVTGKYSGTWTPRHSGPQVTITAKATAPGLPAATTQISGAVVPNVAPVLNHSGTLHIFTPQVGAPLAPGTIVQIYGSQLAQQTLVNTTIPLASSLGGTSVIIGGLQAPLFFVSAGQVNAQIPFELTPGQPYEVIVNNNGALTTPDSIQSTTVAPGVAALPSGAANAQHVADGTGVTEASPAKPGEFVVIYLAGMGATTVPVATGAGAPSSPLAQTSNTPSVTLNSEPVNVLFSGLTPGLAGLYQIDLQVPADAPDGDLSLVVNQPGFQGTSVILPVHH